jgi:hypothetical protein
MLSKFLLELAEIGYIMEVIDGTPTDQHSSLLIRWKTCLCFAIYPLLCSREYRKRGGQRHGLNGRVEISALLQDEIDTCLRKHEKKLGRCATVEFWGRRVAMPQLTYAIWRVVS